MRLRFCGVRGSTPAPGTAFARVGGNTSCVAVTPHGEGAPRLLLDAGTGIRAVTPMLGGDPFRGTILLTHLHWDHWQGLPFFSAGDRDDSEVRLLVPAGSDQPLDVLRHAMSPPHFPIGPEGLKGHWSFGSIDLGTSTIEGLTVTAADVPHKGGRTLAYRVEDEGSSFAYLPDHLPARTDPERRAALDLAAGVDLLIHDAQFITGEEAVAAEYGHATIDQALAFAIEVGAGELVLFHHSPARTDAQMERIAAALEASPITVSIAIEETDRDLPRPRALAARRTSSGAATCPRLPSDLPPAWGR
ncbi:MBL fold metallo-hydrolase [Aquihabitans sp. McL0605]|uniref:MBL fold metallo-hydrolase n=1 Tax=Aquihabitans sp. McL0605 TaxID=3415671 RepID=UPI003CE8A210